MQQPLLQLLLIDVRYVLQLPGPSKALEVQCNTANASAAWQYVNAPPMQGEMLH